MPTSWHLSWKWLSRDLLSSVTGVQQTTGSIQTTTTSNVPMWGQVRITNIEFDQALNQADSTTAEDIRRVVSIYSPTWEYWPNDEIAWAVFAKHTYVDSMLTILSHVRIRYERHACMFFGRFGFGSINLSRWIPLIYFEIFFIVVHSWPIFISISVIVF